MKIIGITASPSRNGNTAALVRLALEAAAESGAETAEIWLPEHSLGFCRGCMLCLKHGDCQLHDDLNDIRNSLYSADGVILGAPAYGLAPNAIMKNFLDRFGLFTVYTSSMAGKYFVGISTAGAVGARRVARALCSMANGFFGRGYVSGFLGVARGWERAERDDKVAKAARGLGRRIVDDISRGRKYRFQNLYPRLVNRFVVGRIMFRNIMTNRDGRMQAVYTNLVRRGIMRE